jgi:hypothetical protein
MVIIKNIIGGITIIAVLALIALLGFGCVSMLLMYV